MAIYNWKMAISVSKFKNSCLDVIRRVEATGQSVSITRRGKVVARLAPSFQATPNANAQPWQQLRALGGELLAEPSESVVREEDFEASSPQKEMRSMQRRRLGACTLLRSVYGRRSFCTPNGACNYHYRFPTG